MCCISYPKYSTYPAFYPSFWSMFFEVTGERVTVLYGTDTGAWLLEGTQLGIPRVVYEHVYFAHLVPFVIIYIYIYIEI